MNRIVKRLVLSLGLLAAASAILLLSDLHSRVGARRSAGPVRIPVAILKHASNRLLDEVERGVLEQLAAAGYQDGERIALQRFSAEGDLPTANAIAKHDRRQLQDGHHDQHAVAAGVANANKDGRAVHVFGGVTDPAGAGVGIRQMDSTDKPRWLAGIGTFQPVEQILREARRLWPDLKTVGVVWNPAERNSETCTLKAREVCRTLGFQLLEATVDQSKDVREAADSLVARGVQAFWTGADVTVMNATASLLRDGVEGQIPVFSNTSGQVREGTLFDLGANYYRGRAPHRRHRRLHPGRTGSGHGRDHQLHARARDAEQAGPERNARPVAVPRRSGRPRRIDHRRGGTGWNERADAARLRRPLDALPAGQQFQIALAYFGPDEGTETCIAGLRDGLGKLGLVEGRNLTVQKVHASGEISGIPAMLQSLDASPVDAIVTFSTPVLTAAAPACVTSRSCSPTAPTRSRPARAEASRTTCRSSPASVRFRRRGGAELMQQTLPGSSSGWARSTTTPRPTR